MATPSFNGLRVLAFESRRAREVTALIENLGGRSISAPALRETLLESNTEALNFAADLTAGRFDIVIFLTGVGARALAAAVESSCPHQAFVEALRKTKVVARGPKPVAVLREWQVPIWFTPPEPNTWHELLAGLDERSGEQPLKGARIAVQEYGVSNTELLDALRTRGALVTRVPVYQWALPDDIEPLKNAVTAVTRNEFDVAIFTTSVQVVHLWQVASDMGLGDDVRRGLTGMIVASIGPTTTEELRRHGVVPDLEASHPKMGLLVREAAERAAGLLHSKREGI